MIFLVVVITKSGLVPFLALLPFVNITYVKAYDFTDEEVYPVQAF